MAYGDTDPNVGWSKRLIDAKYRVLDEPRGLGPCPACAGHGAPAGAPRGVGCATCAGTGREIGPGAG